MFGVLNKEKKINWVYYCRKEKCELSNNKQK